MNFFWIKNTKIYVSFLNVFYNKFSRKTLCNFYYATFRFPEKEVRSSLNFRITMLFMTLF